MTIHEKPMREAIADLTAKIVQLTSERDNLKARNAELLTALEKVSLVAGNLPDDRLTSPTGPMDGAFRGSMVCAARDIARAAIHRAEEGLARE